MKFQTKRKTIKSARVANSVTINFDTDAVRSQIDVISETCHLIKLQYNLKSHWKCSSVKIPRI